MQIGVGIISSLIVFPPLVLLTVLFKRGAVFKKRESRFDRSINEGERIKNGYKEKKFGRDWKTHYLSF